MVKTVPVPITESRFVVVVNSHVGAAGPGTVDTLCAEAVVEWRVFPASSEGFAKSTAQVTARTVSVRCGVSLPYLGVGPYSNQYSVASAFVFRTTPLSLAEVSWISVAVPVTPHAQPPSTTMPRAHAAILEMRIEERIRAPRPSRSVRAIGRNAVSFARRAGNEQCLGDGESMRSGTFTAALGWSRDG